MDRSIMEGDPHSIVEAMCICGYSIGSSKGLVYIRAEYPLAINRLKKAIEQAREYGLLGDHILGTDFCFDIEIRYGAGAFVCGEETALIHSMEGKRGEPTLKPPFPAESGYLGKPTNVNNVETLANIPIILTKGSPLSERNVLKERKYSLLQGRSTMSDSSKCQWEPLCGKLFTK